MSLPLLAQFVWEGDPILFSAGPITLRWYGLCWAGGFLIAFSVASRVFKREGKKDKDLDSLLIWCMAGAILGARLAHVFFYDPHILKEGLFATLAFWRGGLASHGGTLGLVIAIWFYARKRDDQPFLWVIDRVAMLSPICAGLIRIGNFMNSEILGTATEAPWGVVFERASNPELRQFPVHPAQLYEAAVYLPTFVLLFLIWRRFGERTPRGLLVGLLLIIVFGARFGIEFVKQRQTDVVAGWPLSMGQLLSIPAVLIGVYLLVRSFRPENRPAASASS